MLAVVESGLKKNLDGHEIIMDSKYNMKRKHINKEKERKKQYPIN